MRPAAPPDPHIPFRLRPRDIRIIFAALLAAASAGVFTAFAGAGSSSVSQEYQYQYGHKFLMCHETASGTKVEILVDENSVTTHLQRGDTLGPCPA